MWRKEEEEALFKGVAKYGVGLWADILADPAFEILRCGCRLSFLLGF